MIQFPATSTWRPLPGLCARAIAAQRAELSKKLQRNWLAISSNGRFLIVPESGRISLLINKKRADVGANRSFARSTASSAGLRKWSRSPPQLGTRDRDRLTTQSGSSASFVCAQSRALRFATEEMWATATHQRPRLALRVVHLRREGTGS